MNINTPLELVGVGELARRIGMCDNTARRRIERLGIEPDAIDVFAEARRPMFVASRIPEIARLIEPSNPVKV